MHSFALVGCGRVCRKHIEAIEAIPNARLAAVCDSDLARAETAAAGKVVG